MAELVTLSGNYGCIRRRNISTRNNEIDELLGGPLDFIKSVGRVVTTPFKAIGRGVGHATMEVYRGVKTGDPLRIFSSPFKGAGHSFMTQFRDIKKQSEFFYRPSKMRKWMGPAGGILAVLGAIPGPHQVIFLPLGAALSATGGIAEGLYQKDKAKKAITAAEQKAAADAQKTKYIWYGVAALGAAGTLMLVM